MSEIKTMKIYILEQTDSDSVPVNYATNDSELLALNKAYIESCNVYLVQNQKINHQEGLIEYEYVEVAELEFGNWYGATIKFIELTRLPKK